MAWLRRRASCLAAGLLVTAVVGCGDQSAAPKERTVLVEVDPDRSFGDPYADAGPPGQTGPTGPGAPTIILVPAGETERVVNIGGSIELGVLLFDEMGDPVPQFRVSFEMVDDDTADAQLSAVNALTDETGLARVDLMSGSVVQDLTVRVGSRASRSIEFLVHVVELPTGGFEVQLDYAGPIRLGPTEIYLVEDAAWCDDPGYLYPPENILLSTIVDNPAQTADFAPLVSGQRLSILVRSRHAETLVLAAGGCSGDVTVPDDETRRVVVPVLLLPLNATGTYAVDNHFDFTDAIPGTLGDVVSALVQFFGDANHEREVASLIFDAVEALAREAAGIIGGLVVELVRGWVEDDLNDIVNQYIDNDGPEWLRSFFTIGSDLISIVSNQEVVSRIRISKPRADGTFDGSQNWIGLAFYWRLDCDENSPPDCGRHAFTMEQLAAGLEGVDLVFGQFTGRIHSYDQGIFNRHVLDLQYGRLILFVLNNVVLPRIADGANNITDALHNLANCPAFASGITGGRSHLRLGGINIVSRDRIEGWCTTTMDIVGDVANSILGRLRIDTHMSLEGNVVFVEESDDLLVDGMVDGQWRGIIRTADGEGPPFEGDFSGTRQR